jgi:photosystem II stability/assembly factor-like uncharacterized protein
MAEPQGTETQHIVGIGLYAPHRGYMMKSSGSLYHTLDDGAHWTSVPSPKPDGWEFPLSVYAVVTMRFRDSEHGIIVMHLKNGEDERVLASHTADAGQNWISEPVPVKAGPLYISQDGRLLTVITGANMMTLLRYNGK